MDISKRLLELYNTPLLPQDHVQYLYYMRDELKIYPTVCYDIGACVLHWTNIAKEVWPEAEFILFEAMDSVEFLYKSLPFKYEIGVFSNVDDRDIKFYQNDFHPGGNSYYRENVEISPLAHEYFNKSHVKMRKTKTIDKVVSRNGFPLPDLVKIDVQGCEVDILKGMSETLKTVNHMIVELQNVPYNSGAPTTETSIPFIESLGFSITKSRFSNSKDDKPDSDYHFTKS